MLSDSDNENVMFNRKNNRKYSSASLESTSSRGGESPMEIDSPPPLWLKSPMNTATQVEVQTTPFTPINTSNTNNIVSNEPITTTTASSPSASSLASPKLSPLNTATSLKSSPVVVKSVSLNNSPLSNVTTGKSPLRSCHTNADAVVQLRRLTAATFAPSTSPGFRRRTTSLTPSRQQTLVKKTPRDPTKVAAAAALVSSSTTAWHLHLPIILMNYFQLFFNTLIGVGMLYLAFSATRTVLHDAQLKVDERLQVMVSEIALCSRQYIDNRCSPDLRVPAMEKACMEWETCMSRDPSTTSRARLHAETIAEILNGFFGAISTRTYVFMISGAVLVMVLFNAAFYFGRHQQTAPPAPPVQRLVDYHSSHHHPSSPFSSYHSSTPGSPLMLK